MPSSKPATDSQRSSPPGSTSSSLVEKVKTGQSEAWARLVELYGPTVYRWCRQRGLAAEDSEDICQEVFTSVASVVHRFRRERPGDSFRGWLWTITRNKARDYLRRRAGKPSAAGGSDNKGFLAGLTVDSAGVFDSPEPAPDGPLVRRALELVRKEVEPSSWLAFWRIAVEGQSSAEVAHDLGLTPSAVRQAKYRVLRRLRRELDAD
jgi:RNA polymerase sigma-70 factor, ECF subfamily